MNKYRNEKIRLLLTVVVCVLFIALAFSTTSGETLSERSSVTEEIEYDNSIPKSSSSKSRLSSPLLLPPFLLNLVNGDWNYWTNTPNMYAIPDGNVGIGTTTPNYKLQVVSNDPIAGHFTTDYPEHYVPVLYARYTGTGEYDAIAIEGISTPSNDWGIGGRFEGGSTGIQGGVYSNGEDSYMGVYGFAAHGDGDNYGVKGVAGGDGYNYGIHGSCGTGSGVKYAGYFLGDVHITDDLTVSGYKFFKIDHPLDPENKYLYHYCIESSDMKNVYDGVTDLDDNGESWVELPEWFEAINCDFRYQLTCIGGFAPVYIAEEISENQFKIAGGNPGMKVSWQVTGIRNDPYAKQYKTPVVEYKSEHEQGTYLHPELYGMPETMGLDYRHIDNLK